MRGEGEGVIYSDGVIVRGGRLLVPVVRMGEG